MSTDEDFQARVEAFWAATEGDAGEIPPYTVSTNPVDNSFAVFFAEDLDPVGRSLVAGDVSFRFNERERTGVDTFADRRVPWPEHGQRSST